MGDRSSSGASPLIIAAFAGPALSLITGSAPSAVDVAAIGLGAAGIIGGAMLLAKRGELSIDVREPVVAAGLAFIGWMLVCALVSGRGWSAFVGEPTNLIGWFALVAMAAVALAASWRADEVVPLLRTVALVAVAFQVLLAVVQLVAGRDVRGTLPNSTYLGEFVVMLLPFAAREAKRYVPAGGAVLASATAATLAAAGSRLAAAAALAYAVFAAVPSVASNRRTRTRVQLASIALVVLAGLAFARAEILGSLTWQTLGARPEMWREGCRAVLARPLFGFGPDGFVSGGASVSTVAELAAGRILTYWLIGAVDPHAFPVWVGVSGGVPGLLLMAWFSVALALRWARTRARVSAARDGAWAFGMASAVFLAAPAAMQVLPLAALALGVSLPGLVEERGHRGTAASTVLVAIICAASVLYAASAATRLPFEDPSSDRSPARAAASWRAAAVWRFDPYLWYLASQHLGWAAHAGIVPPTERADLIAAERAAAYDRRHPFYALEVARCHVFYGSHGAVIEAAYAETFRRWPAFPLARAERALYLARSGRREEAERELGIAELVREQDGDLREAVAAARALLAK